MRRIFNIVIFIVIFLAINNSCGPSNGIVDHSIKPEKRFERRKKLEYAMERYKPKIVILGNSMVTEGVDMALFNKLTRIPTIPISNGGSASAWWYLTTKNVICDARSKPEMLIIYFRDTALTEPAYRVTDRYLPTINDMMEGEEPLLDKLAYYKGKSQLEVWLIEKLSIFQKRQNIKKHFTKSIKHTTEKLAGLKEGGSDKVIENVFANKNLNQDLMTIRQEKFESTKPKNKFNFDTAVSNSFLPEIISLTQEHKIKLVFVRVKQRRDLTANNQSSDLIKYIEDLNKYLSSYNIPLFDFTNDPRLNISHYADGDHLNRETGRPLFTRMVIEKVQPLFWKYAKEQKATLTSNN